jgi:putative two-component system response regulator
MARPLDSEAFMSQRTLLIIDDSPEWTDLLSAFFSGKYRVQVTNSAKHAIQLALQDPPSVIIVDLVMPFVDGFGVIERLKDTPAGEVPTVLLTGWNTLEVEECAESIGCAAVLSKSASLFELDEAVSSAARRAA